MYALYRNYCDPITYDEYVDDVDTLAEAQEYKIEIAEGDSEGQGKEAFCEALSGIQIVPEFDMYYDRPTDYPGPGVNYTWNEDLEHWVPYVSPRAAVSTCC